MKRYEIQIDGNEVFLVENSKGGVVKYGDAASALLAADTERGNCEDLLKWTEERNRRATIGILKEVQGLQTELAKLKTKRWWQFVPMEDK